ncbi:MAG: DUF3060 domain-containing protein [Pyrinomonadaceae bacterium]|nr:DUF3060 domain-containing protein [Pyrinomonadaceae bacterium]
MKKLLLICTLAALPFAAACDPQSEITKKGLEKYGPTPTPSVEPTPTPVPIDPADAIPAASGEEGPMLIVNKAEETKPLNCDKYNQVMVNSRDHKVTIKGACRQLVVNGNGNEITAEGISEIIFNGENNRVTYSKYVNAKHPQVRDNKGSNAAEKAAAEPQKSTK